MNIIDTHTHVFPDNLAYNTVAEMAEKAGVKLYSDGTLNGLIKNMKKNGVAYSAILPIATKPSQVKSINNWIHKNRKENIIPFGTIHPDFSDIENELKDIKAKGFYGIKLHPDYQAFYPTEARLYPIYEICSSLNLIIIFHCGDDIGHPAPGHSLPRLFVKVITDFPNLTIIASHLAGFEMWDQALKYLIGKDIFIETSFTLGYIDMDRFYEIINKHNKDYILLGSDSPWGSIKAGIEGIRKSKLTTEIQEKILSYNAVRLFGL